jgi:tripartite-type tricarboxylate transporter receptor subunit TctC
MFAPAKTPRDIVERLHRETVKALQSEGLRDKLKTFDVEPMAMTPTEFDSFIRQEIVANAALAKAAGLKPN